MLIHGRASLTRLATTLEQIEHPEVETRRLSSAVLREEDIDTLARVYKDVLLADLDPQDDEELFDFLATEGFDLASALTEGGRDEITRSDATELLAAAALIGSDSWDPDYMFMPNVPKMSRAKSDSGWDVLEVRLQPGKGALSPLTSDEWLRVASVKHSVLAESGSMMSKLKASFRTELSAAYVATQLRVIHHRLRESGRSKTDSDRIYLLASAHVSGGKNIRLSAVGVVDETTLGDALTRGRSALNDQENWERLAVLGVARLAELHVRCN